MTTIRESVPADEQAVVALWHSTGLVVSYNDPVEDFRFALESACSTILVADAGDGEIIGSVMVGHDGHRGWLYYVASAPERRRQGIGRMMVDAGERWLREHGIGKAQLLVRETNKEVAAFYRQLGYEEVPRIVMSRWLQDSAA